VDELESDQPGIFGTKGGYSRSFSLTNVSFVSGLVVGPLLSGILVDSVGYYYMNCTLGEMILQSLLSGNVLTNRELACICVLMSIVAFSLLSGKSALKRYDRAE
jgi:MFS family permease